MQWAAGSNAGFTTGTPWEALEPNDQTANVAAETNDPGSLLSFYKTMLAIRANNPILRSGTLALLSTGNSGIYATLRIENGTIILVLANLTANPITTYALSGGDPAIEDGTYHPISILGSGSFFNW